MEEKVLKKIQNCHLTGGGGEYCKICAFFAGTRNSRLHKPVLGRAVACRLDRIPKAFRPLFRAGAGRSRVARKAETGMSIMVSNLLSGLVGSVLTMMGALVWEGVKRRNARKSLYQAIATECRYNLSILDEVVDGLHYQGSFKRLSVEFFKTMRQQAVDYAVRADLLSALSRVIVDLELLNTEANFVFNGNGGDGQCTYVGQVDKKVLYVVKNPLPRDIRRTVDAARVGVRNSLNDVLKIVSRETNEEE